MPTLTIITIVKDDLAGFIKTVESIISELTPDIEFLIIDSSGENEIENFVSNIDEKKYRYLYQKASGIYPAMNFGLVEAQGKWLWFLNAGDTKFGPTSLSEVISSLEISRELDAIVFPVNHVIHDDLIWSTTLPEVNFVNGSLIIDCNHQGFIARKEAILLNGSFDTQYSYAADSKLMDSVARNGRIHIDHRVISNFQIGGTSSTNFRRVVEEIAKHRHYEGINEYLESHKKVFFRNQLRLLLIKMISFLPRSLRPALICLRNNFRA